MKKPENMALRVVSKTPNYDKIRAKLEAMALGANTTCKDFSACLVEFGFILKDCGAHGHKVATHPAIKMKIEDSPNFNCGHSSGKKIKPIYIRKFLRITNTYESDLKEYLK